MVFPRDLRFSHKLSLIVIVRKLHFCKFDDKTIIILLLVGSKYEWHKNSASWISPKSVKKIVDTIEDKEKRKKKNPDVLKLTPLKLESKPKIKGGGISKKKPVKTATPNQKQVNLLRNFLTPTGGKTSREMQPNNKANLAATFNPILPRLSHSSRIEMAGQSDEGSQNDTEFRESGPCDMKSDWKRRIDDSNFDQ